MNSVFVRNHIVSGIVSLVGLNPVHMPPSLPSVRVIVRLPYNRPEEPLPNPPLVRPVSSSEVAWHTLMQFPERKVEWNSEKEHILWEVIAKSRATEGAATDCKYLKVISSTRHL